MASVWIERRRVGDGSTRFRVRFRLGGSESIPKYAGSFKTKRDAQGRSAWVMGELAAVRVPELGALAEPDASPTLREVAGRWQASRGDVREATRIQHRTALGRVLPLLGSRPLDSITADDVQELVDALNAQGKAR